MVIKLVLTFPKSFSYRLVIDKLRDKTMLMGHKCTKEFFKRLPEVLGVDIDYKVNHLNQKLGYYYDLQDWLSSNPLSPHLHAHASLLNLITSSNPKFPLARFNPILPVDSLRKLWREVLINNNVLRDSDKNVDIHIAFNDITKKAKNLNWLKYSNRHPLFDLYDYYNDHDFDSLQIIDESFVASLIDFKPRRRVFGFLRNLSKLSLKAVFCPICGSVATRNAPISVEAMKQILLDGSIMIAYYSSRLKSVFFYTRAPRKPIKQEPIKFIMPSISVS